MNGIVLWNGESAEEDLEPREDLPATQALQRCTEAMELSSSASSHRFGSLMATEAENQATILEDHRKALMKVAAAGNIDVEAARAIMLDAAEAVKSFGILRSESQFTEKRQKRH